MVLCIITTTIIKQYTYTGLPLKKIFPGLPNFFQVFKVCNFWSILSLKLSLRLKTVLNSIKTLKRYCIVTLNVFFNIKIL